MIPTLLELGPISLHTYGLCLALGLIVGHYLLTLELRRKHLPESFAGLQITLAAIFGIAGSRLFDIFEHPDPFFANPVKTLLSGSGLTWYGGFIMATAAVWVAARIKKISFLEIIESSTPGLAIGYGFGRLGCFLSGDGCYGVACAADLPAPLCMAFPNGIVPTAEVVYNTPLWEIGGAIATFAYIWSVRKRIKRAPMLFLQFIIIHGALRFLVEFVRRNPELAFGLSQAQVISIGMILAGIIGLVLMHRGLFPEGYTNLPTAPPEPEAATAGASKPGPPAQRHASRKKGKGRKKRR